MINKQSYQISGMRQDNLVGTGYSSKFAHEIVNMRLNTIGDYTTASWTTEKGTKQLDIEKMPYGSNTYEWITDKIWYIYSEVHGQISREFGGYYELSDFKPIGQANINDQWILFGVVTNKDITVDGQDSPDSYSVIVQLDYRPDVLGVEHLYGRLLYWGQLGFNVNNPIETITFYENELLQKVYWTDGINQPRMINIKGVENLPKGYNDDKTNSHNYIDIPTLFDFIQEVNLDEDVEITKDQSGNGMFPPCTVKYVLTYYHKYGQETNIIYDSPLYYPTKGDRGCSPDELSGDSFVIKVKNIDTQHGFDYIRLYSIVKTSNNATPIVRIVADKEIATLPVDTNNDKYALFVDTNTTGEIVDPSILNYIGGWKVTIGTFTTKDNVLFAGSLTLKNESLKNVLAEESIDENNLTFIPIVFEQDDKKIVRTYKPVEASTRPSAFAYYNQLNSGSSFDIKSFKCGEAYRFGIQFQDKYGRWSEVVKLNDDVVASLRPEILSTDKSCYKLAYATYTIPASIRQKLRNHYKKARLVCCYTTNADRNSILQGVLNTTVYNVGEQADETIDTMASWFFRPIGGDAQELKYNQLEPSTLIPNRFIPWEDEEALTNSGRSNGEIQSLSTRTVAAKEPTPDYYNNNWNEFINAYRQWIKDQFEEDRDGDKPYAKDNKGSYKVTDKILTLNSPEIDFDESLTTLPLDKCSIKKIGKIPIDSFVSRYYIDANGVGIAINDDAAESKGSGFVNKSKIYQNLYTINPNQTIGISIAGTHDIMAGYWDDIDVYENNAWRCGFPLYPFQRQGSLNEYMGDADGTTKSAELNSKVFATLMYANNIEYLSSGNSTDLNTKEFSLYNYTENVPIRIDSKTYYGNMNSIVPLSDGRDLCALKNGTKDTFYGNYKLYEYYAIDNYNVYKHQPNGSRYWHYDTDSDTEGGVSSNPIPLTYKSSPHIVISTNESITKNVEETQTPYIPYLYLVDMVRENVSEDSQFGGKNNKANIYTPCGPAESLEGNGSLQLYGFEGDHYFMRYDCLKTYPYTTEDTNQIVEILSFMCESRVNLDGRYDKNRGLTDNTMVTNTNFNLINQSYTQDNNTFTFTTLDELSSKLNTFPNQITWTSPKVSGEDIDAWTNITLASVADADGTLGKITKLTSLNDKLLLFQDHGLAQINYNENTAISTENGIPLELAKTGKFTGFDYISKEVGCQNKWSVSQSKNGLFWIDDSRQELLTLGEGIQSLSTVNGFDAFMINQLPKTFKAWNPSDFYNIYSDNSNFVTYYDKLSNDIYYINNNNCIAWNEQTHTFTSFYNYERVPYMVNIGQHSLMWKDGVWAAREADSYSTFFGHIKDYSMTLVCDGQTDKGSAFAADKVFNNIEYRADIYNLDGTNTNYSNSIFSLKHVWNGYQDSHEVALDGERKFNTWRVQLPRHYGTRDRIRNPFCYIKLKQDNTSLGRPSTQTDRVILHDLAVYFDMR